MKQVDNFKKSLIHLSCASNRNFHFLSFTVCRAFCWPWRWFKWLLQNASIKTNVLSKLILWQKLKLNFGNLKANTIYRFVCQKKLIGFILGLFEMGYIKFPWGAVSEIWAPKEGQVKPFWKLTSSFSWGTTQFPTNSDIPLDPGLGNCYYW